MASFEDTIHGAAIAEAKMAVRDPERMSVMIETFARALGFTIAVAARGDSRGIDTLMTGAEAYAHEEAVEKAPLAKILALAAERRP